MRSNPNDTLAQPSAFVRSGSTLTVTIGRNVGEYPMSRERWAAFESAVIDRLSALVRPSFTFTYRGQGEWNGTTEDSAAILIGDTRYTVREDDVRSILSTLSAEYDQDAIGYTFGAASLATR